MTPTPVATVKMSPPEILICAFPDQSIRVFGSTRDSFNSTSADRSLTRCTPSGRPLWRSRHNLMTSRFWCLLNKPDYNWASYAEIADKSEQSDANSSTIINLKIPLWHCCFISGTLSLSARGCELPSPHSYRTNVNLFDPPLSRVGRDRFGVTCITIYSQLKLNLNRLQLIHKSHSDHQYLSPVPVHDIEEYVYDYIIYREGHRVHTHRNITDQSEGRTQLSQLTNYHNRSISATNNTALGWRLVAPTQIPRNCIQLHVPQPIVIITNSTHYLFFRVWRKARLS